MSDFRILVEGGYQGRHYGLEFATDRKPRTQIALAVPNSKDKFEIKAEAGRSLGDNEEGTPATVTEGKWHAPATYYDKGTYGQVFVGERV